MKLREFRLRIAEVPDDAEIRFADGNFEGPGEDFDAYTVRVSEDKKEVLLRPPHWEALD